MYVYYNDGTSSQWVEHRSQIARNQVGLVPITPTSVTVGSGTASISSSGDITCTGVSSISFNSVFSSSFKTYKIFMTASGNASLPINLRLRSGSTDATTSIYQWMTTRVYFPINQAALGGSGAAFAEIGYTGGNGIGFSQIELSDPYSASNTFAFMSRIYSNECVTGGFWHNANTSYDGFTIYPTTSTISGTFKIYGYN